MFYVYNVGVPLAVTAAFGFDVIKKAASNIWETDTVQNMVGRVTVAAKRQLTKTCTDALVKKPHPLINTLIEKLEVIEKKIQQHVAKTAEGSGIEEPDPEFLEQEIAEAREPLSLFIQNYEKVLSGARYGDGTLIRLKKDEMKFLSTLFDDSRIQALNLKIPQALEFFQKVQASQSGIVTQIVGSDVPGAQAIETLSKQVTKALSGKPHDAMKNLIEALEIYVNMSEKGKEDGESVPIQKLETLFLHFKKTCKEDIPPEMALFEKALASKNLAQQTAQETLRFLRLLKTSQTGYLEQIKSYFLDEGFKKFLQAMGISNPDLTHLTATRDESKKAQIEAIRRLNKRQEKEVPPQDLKASLEEKLNNIADLSIKMVLTRLIFDSENWKETFIQIHREALEKEQSFFTCLENTFHISDLSNSYYHRVKKWFFLNIAEPLIRRYILKAVSDMKADLIRFLDPSTRRIDTVFNFVLKPIQSHMTHYSTFIPTLQGKVVESYDKEIQSHFDGMVDAKLRHFTSAMVEKYTYSLAYFSPHNKLHLAASAASLVMLVVSFAQHLRTSIKVASFFSLVVTTGLFEKMLNFSIKWVAKRKSVEILKKEFFETDPTRGRSHSRIQHLINEQILEKLTQFNTDNMGPLSHSSKVRSAPSTKKDLDTVIRQLLATLPLSLATTTSESFRNHFQNTTLAEKFKTEFFSIVDLLTPSISEEILKGLERLLSDEKKDDKPHGPLSDFVWQALNSIERSLTSESRAITQAQMDATEGQLEAHLKLTLEKVVSEGIKLALDPSKKLQEEANATLIDIRAQTDLLIESLKELTLDEKKFAEVYGQYKKLCADLLEMVRHFESKPIVGELSSKFLTSFQTATENLHGLITTIDTHLLDRKKDSEKINVLEKIKKRFQDPEGTVSYNAKDNKETLGILKSTRHLPKELIDSIDRFERFLDDYLIARPDKELNKLYKKIKTDFIQELDGWIKTHNDQKKEIEAKINTAIKSIRESNDLNKWRLTIEKPIVIKPSDVKSFAATLVGSVPVEKYAAPTMMYFVMELLRYKNKPYHWKGVLSSVAEACSTI